MRKRTFDPRSTSAIYENPTNGWREGVPKLAWLWMFLFGIFYMAARSLWRPLGVSIGILFAVAFLFAPLLILAVPLLWIACAAQAQNMFRAHYMRQGWTEIDPYEQNDIIL